MEKIETNGDVLRAAIRLLSEKAPPGAVVGYQTVEGPVSVEDPERQQVVFLLKNMVAEHRCFVKAGVKEPIFTLRAQDRLAPRLIRKWAKRAKRHGADRGKVKSAEFLADAMKNWSARRYPT